MYITLKHIDPLNAAHSRFQSLEFWSPVHTPVCHYHTLFSSILCTPSLWGIVCFVTHFYSELWFSHNWILPCMIVFGCLTNDAFCLFGFPVINQLPDLPDDVTSLFPACNVAFLDPLCMTLCLPLDPATCLLLWSFTRNTCCALRLKPALCLPSCSLHPYCTVFSYPL